MGGWTWAWLFILLQGLLLEGAGIALNEKYDLDEDKKTGRAKRTATENLRWLFATDKDSARARWRGLRRTALLGGMAWLTIHLAVVNWV